MSKKCNRLLAFLLAFALVLTTFGSDWASVKTFADEGSDETPAVTTSAEAEPAQEVQSEEPSDEGGDDEYVEESEGSSEEEVAPAEEPQGEEIASEGEGEGQGENLEGEGTEGEEPEVTEEDPEAIDPEKVDPEAVDPEALEKEAAEKAAKEKEETEKTTVTVTYESTKGGSVSPKSETIDPEDEEAAFKGSTAAPWNDGYEFVNWTDAEGNQVSEDATFVPSDITEDATFTAHFTAVENIKELMPELSKTQSAGGMTVSVSAEEGLFPEGTSINISPISDDDALATAQDALGEKVNSAKGVDITFVYNGEEIQPADSKYVHVSISLDQALDGDDFALIHDHDGGLDVIEDADVSATGASFDANQFSIFIIADTDQPGQDIRKVVEYKFWNDPEMTSELISQKVKNDDELFDPGYPTSINNSEKQRFIKWEKEDGSDISFGTVSDITESTPAVVNIIPVIEETYYVQYHGLEDEIAYVEEYKVVSDNPDSKYIDLLSQHSLKADNGEAFAGWSKSNASDKSSRELVSANGKENWIDVTEEDRWDVYAKIISAYWIHFNGNGVGASYTAPTYLKAGQTLSEISAANPTREGYAFVGWALSADATQAMSGEVLAKEIQKVADAETKTLDLYAVWQAEGETFFTVILWKQKVTDKYDQDISNNTYDYYKSYKKDGVAVGTDITDELISSAVGKDYKGTVGDKGFTFEDHTSFINTSTGNATTKIEARGNTVVNVYYEREVITLTFYTYGAAQGYIATDEISNNETYYGTDGQENFFELEKHSDYSFEMSYTVGRGRNSRTYSYSGDVYTRHVEGYGFYAHYVYDKADPPYSSRNYYGLVDGDYVPITIVQTETVTWFKKGTSEEYQGIRFRKAKAGDTNWNVYDTYTALYGQTLSDAGYSWPVNADWYDKHSSDGTASGIHTTFIDTFINSYDYYGKNVAYGNYSVTHYKEGLEEGTYKEANKSYVSGYATFYFSNKYEGFVVDSYQCGYNGGHITYSYVDEKDTYSPASTNLNYNNLSIKYKRKSYTLQFVDVTPGDNTTSDVTSYTVKYEAPLSGYASTENTKTHDGYIFKGWYEDKEGTQEFIFSTTMPAADKIVYGVWEPATYKVTLLGNGGTLSDDAATRFKFDDDNNPYLEVLPTSGVTEPMIAGVYTKEGYIFTGWSNEDGSQFCYGKINSDITLTAGWRRVAPVYVRFDADPEGKGIGSYTEGRYHSDGKAYASNSAFVFAAPPTNVDEEYVFFAWEYNGKQYNPNDKAAIVESLIEDADGEKDYITVKAVYKKKGEPGTEPEDVEIKYDPNVSSIEKQLSDISFAEGITLNADEGTRYSIGRIPVNEGVVAKGQIFIVEKYQIESWNTMPDGSGLKVDLGKKYIAADNKDDKEKPKANSKANVLYAQWVSTGSVEVTVHIIGKKAQETFDGELKSVEGYIISFDEQPYDEIARNTAAGTVLGTAPEGFDVKDIKCAKAAKAEGVAPDTYPMGLTEKDFSYTGDKTAFTVTFDVHDGELEIVAGDKIPLTMTSKDVNSVYNGMYQTYVLLPGVDPEQTEGTENAVESAINGIRQIWNDFFVITADAAAEGEVEFTYHGQKYVATNVKIQASGADYGTYDFELVNPISDIRIMLGEKDVTECFEIKTKLGVLNIEKAVLTITAIDNWKFVNTNDPELKLFIDGLVGSDSVEGMFKAVRDEGETVRSYPIHVVRTEAEEGYLVEADLEYNVLDNYKLIINEGTFRIRARTNPNPPDDNPTGDPGTPTTPTETPAPSGVVLGATRGNEQVLGATREQAAVLGARRGRTEDSTNNLARMLAILIAGVVSVSLLATGRKKEEEEQ